MRGTVLLVDNGSRTTDDNPLVCIALGKSSIMEFDTPWSDEVIDIYEMFLSRRIIETPRCITLYITQPGSKPEDPLIEVGVVTDFHQVEHGELMTEVEVSEWDSLWNLLQKDIQRPHKCKASFIDSEGNLTGNIAALIHGDAIILSRM